MATAVAMKAKRPGTTCARCGGLMVGEFCMDLANGTGELEFLASRCVQCGEVVDPLILKHRTIQRPSTSSLTNRKAERTATCDRVTTKL